jgi:CHAT domain-containing protein/tetratricopeptide (TPR) repeat protein
MFTPPSRIYAVLVVAICLLISSSPTSRVVARNSTTTNAPADDANAALEQGKRLLRRMQADLAYNSLQSALETFTRDGNKQGMAAAQDAMGDLYTLNGQYLQAIKFYRSAQTGFQQLNDTSNSNAVLAKIGEHYFLLGDLPQARTAFASMTVVKPEQALKDATGEGGTPSGKGQATALGAAALASIASCLKANTPGSNDNNRQDPPNQGHSPETPYGSGRLDLRITNEEGEAVKGVQAQLQSKRPGDIFCDCWNTSDEFGRALMPPLHIAPQVKVVLKAPGLPKQELMLTAQDLAQPVRVVLSKTGARIAQQVQQQFLSNIASPCFNFYRALIAFGTSELGQARADFYDDKLPQARARYENLITQLSLPGFENLDAVPLFRTAARTALGDIAFKEGKYQEAVKLYKEAADGATKDRRPDLQWAAQRGLGRSLWRQSLQGANQQQAIQLRNEAYLAYQQALRTIEKIRAGSLRADEVRSNFLASTKDVYDEAGAVLAQLALAASGPTAGADAGGKAVTLTAMSFAGDGYKTIDQGRARSLLEMLGEAHAGITEGVPADLVKRRGEIVDRQQEIAEMLMGVALPDKPPTKAVPELEAELDALSLEYDGLENRIRTSNPRYGSLAGVNLSSLADVQQKILDADTALLMYSLGTDESYLWVVTQKTVAVSRLPGRAIIEDLVLKVRAQLVPGTSQRGLAGIELASDTTRSLDIANDGQPTPRLNQARDAGAYARAAYDLYNTILKPAAELVEGKRLMVVADGALNYVPYAALVTSVPDGKADFSSLPYLIKTHEVVYAPSASVVNEAHQNALKNRQPSGGAGSSSSMLIIADPVFSSSDVRLRLDGATITPVADTKGTATRQLTLDAAVGDVLGKSASASLNIPRLINTRSEATDIAQLARKSQGKADVWLDLDASENNVLTRDVRGYRIVHFATHGLLNTEHPDFTGLVLSLVGSPSGDGFLRVNEIFNMKLGTPFVMMSACETGLGREKRGEGIIGLTRAFMYAGAPTVGVTLWAVADRSTATLMTDFYTAYLANNQATPSAALRDAQLKMISNPSLSAPYYWAPFVIVGDWSRN